MKKSGSGLSRRALLKSTVAMAAVGAMRATAADSPRLVAFDLEEATIADLQAGMESGRYTARALVEKYLARIAVVDQRGPAIHQILEINPDALSIADALDVERKEKGPRSPLHGIPVLLKDNIDTHDGMTTTAGSLALEGSVPLRDAFLVERLRAAGAIPLGKTNMSEWANIRSTRGSSGWSARGGQGKNPYVLDRSTSGSSSGSAAAVAANLCAAAIGTETDGSIVSPASSNSLVGVKPTLGLVSRFGIIPIAHSQDTAGPLTRTVTDAAILLSAIAGSDPRDAATREASVKGADYRMFLERDGLRGARLGLVDAKKFGVSSNTDAILQRSIAAMKEKGATVTDVDLENIGEYDNAELDVLLYELKADLNAYLAGLGPDAPVKSLAEVIAFNEEHREEEMPYFGQELFLRAEAKGALTSKEYLDALAKCRELSRSKGIDKVLREKNLDALVSITNGPAWLIDLVNGDHWTGGNSTASAVAGYPHITVPAGYVFGLPIGISFFAGAWSEPVLFRLAFAFEQATKARMPPRFLPTVRL